MLTSFWLLGSSRLQACIRAVAFQGALLGLVPLCSKCPDLTARLAAVAILSTVIKAIELASATRQLSFDTGRCLFCSECARACDSGAVQFTREFRLASSSRTALVVTDNSPLPAVELDDVICRALGRALRLRQVSAGGCNACEADTNVLNTVGWDLGRFGVQFVASPRHADGLLITGPVTQNMRAALDKTYQAVPAPKIVIAVGACAIAERRVSPQRHREHRDKPTRRAMRGVRVAYLNYRLQVLILTDFSVSSV